MKKMSQVWGDLKEIKKSKVSSQITLKIFFPKKSFRLNKVYKSSSLRTTMNDKDKMRTNKQYLTSCL
jgi:hypothetical protein